MRAFIRFLAALSPAVLIATLCAAPASAAGTVSVRIANGRVSVIAKDATLGDILDAWSKAAKRRSPTPATSRARR